MSTLSILTSVSTTSGNTSDKGHKRLLALGAILAFLGAAALLVYGLTYYLEPIAQRPYDPRHQMLQPGGLIGVSLGIFGVFLFCLIFLYPLRKRWQWLASKGNSRHWFNFHILIGVTAPVVIAFHASFKFRGLAGTAYWIMFAVALSGIVGRYIYAQVPRSRNSTELSLQDLKELQEKLMERLAAQRLVRPVDLANLFRLPAAIHVQRRSMLLSFCALLWIDLKRPFRVARLRRQALGLGDTLLTIGGLFSSRNRELERVVALAREQARLSKKLLFLAKSQQILHLWHVIHRPFSYSFAVLALTHIAIALLFGFRT
ncbi:MAG: hypothetical protein ACM3SW_16495 [Actinomycetota bacterium]